MNKNSLSGRPYVLTSLMGTQEQIKLSLNLKTLMARKNLTLTATAKHVGMNKSTLHNYCNGVIPRNLLKIKELADYLEVSLNELIFGPNLGPHFLDGRTAFEGRYEVIIKPLQSSRVDGKTIK